MNADLYHKVAELTRWWTNPASRKLWFSGMDPTSPDAMDTDRIVYNKCQDLGITLNHITNLVHIENWPGTLDLKLNLDTAVGYIILTDQIIRHLLRYHYRNPVYPTLTSNQTLHTDTYIPSLSPVTFQQFSRVAALVCGPNYWNLHSLTKIRQVYDLLGAAGVVFCAMPLRHVRHPSSHMRTQIEKQCLDIAIQLTTWYQETLNTPPDTQQMPSSTTDHNGTGSIVKSFYRACLLQHYKSRMNLLFTQLECCTAPYQPAPIDPTILDQDWCREYDPHQPFQLHMAQIPAAFYMPIVAMLEANPDVNHLIVSVSGGVDSMVLLVSAIRAISHVWNTRSKHVNGYKYRRHIALSVVHINYGNRSTANTEEELVRRFVHELNTMQRHISSYGPAYHTHSYHQTHSTGKCKNRYLDNTNSSKSMLPPGFRVQLVVSWAADIIGKRDVAPYRDLYETVTRVMRFDTYKEAAARYNLDSRHSAVLLGHNNNDVLENVLTNIAESKLSSLGGMAQYGQEHGLAIWRPFLDIPKRLIYETATNMDIPHVYDSTPKWCVRGKLRDHVIPAIMENLPGFMIGVNNLVRYTTVQAASYRNDVQTVIKHRYVSVHKFYAGSMDTTGTFGITYQLDIDRIFKTTDTNLLSDVLVEIAKKEGMPYPTHAGVSHIYRSIMKAHVSRDNTKFTGSINKRMYVEVTLPYKLYVVIKPF